ncbi:phospholipase A2 inhibitor and Ly6/PLAUR domain-containing protein-like [Leptodactylus fuscus]|uniref:phospholipase A2 inhibitor and Ly6/PLAUR domain-containing protein-like n=1 Tax=Leptodactylus fuscus TaxID=238119 RepID=UPI003F4EB05F
MVFCLLFLSVICTLTTTGYSLSCVQCKDATDVPCTGDSEPCHASDEVCISRSILTIVAGVPFSKMFMRGCGEPAQCSLSNSFSTPHGRVITSTTCCNKNDCTPPRPTLPSVTSNKNGVVCKSCQTLEATPCVSNIYMDCVGNETKCISQVTKFSGLPSSAIRGCATPNLCRFPHEKGTFGHLEYSTDITCTDGGASLHYCLSLLAVTFLVLFKVSDTGLTAP